jgi:prepilin peptidase CpaA
MTAMFIGLCVAVFVYDILFRRVPNQLIVIALLIHAVDLIWTGSGINGINVSQSLLGGAIGLALFIPFYALKAMGAGDVKFFALLGLLLGSQTLLPVWLISSLMAGVHALGVYLSRLHIIVMPGLTHLTDRVTASRIYQRMLKKRQGRKGIPYAAYLSVAAIITNAYQV